MPSLLVYWAVFSVVVGAVWAGTVAHQAWLIRHHPFVPLTGVAVAPGGVERRRGIDRRGVAGARTRPDWRHG